MPVTKKIDDNDSHVISLISKQETATRWVWCRQCGEQFQEVMPVHMRIEQLMCRGCHMDGFLVGHAHRDHDNGREFKW